MEKKDLLEDCVGDKILDLEDCYSWMMMLPPSFVEQVG